MTFWNRCQRHASPKCIEQRRCTWTEVYNVEFHRIDCCVIGPGVWKQWQLKSRLKPTRRKETKVGIKQIQRHGRYHEVLQSKRIAYGCHRVWFFDICQTKKENESAYDLHSKCHCWHILNACMSMCACASVMYFELIVNTIPCVLFISFFFFFLSLVRFMRITSVATVLRVSFGFDSS